MVIALWGFALIVGVALLGALAIVSTPMLLSLSAETAPRPRLAARARLLGGASAPIRLYDSARPRRRAAAKPSEASERADQWSAARMRRVVEAAAALLADLLRLMRLHRLDLDAEIGMEDPADTGQLYGFLSALARAGSCAETLSLSVRPVFDGPRLSGRAEAEVSFTPIVLAAAALRFALAVYRPQR